MAETAVNDQEHIAQLEALAPQGAEAILTYIAGFDEPTRRRLASLAQRSLFSSATDAAGLDLYVAVLRGLIDRETRDLGPAGRHEERDNVMDHYNALSYNFAADLADCWPGDELPRETRHFEAGLRAAEECIRWRNELAKPPRSFSIAYWAKGIHLLALGHYNGAVKSFNMALGFALRDAQDKGQLAPIGADSTFDILLNTGYLCIAEELDGQPAGRDRYDQVLAAFQEQLGRAANTGDSELKQEAELGMGQLQKVRGKYL
jgi:hypothetical protein